MLNIPAEKILKCALSTGGDFAEIFAEETVTTSLAHEGKRLERASHGIDSGYGIRVLFDGHTAYGFTNDPSTLLETARSVSNAVEKRTSTAGALNINLPKREKQPDFSIDIKKTTKIVTDAANIAWDSSELIRQVQTNFKQLFRKVYIVNSEGLFVTDERQDTVMFIMVVAGKDGVIQTGTELIGGNCGLDYFLKNRPEDVAAAASARALLMLSADNAPRGIMPIVISSSAGGTMIHEAVGHGFEADLASAGLSVYKDKLGKEVASKKVTVVDDATIALARGSSNFDDEGTKCQKTILIENGILKNYMQSRLTANKMGVSPTGNGRRESYRYRPIVRMTNTLIVSGSDTPESVTSSVNNGLLVKKIGGGQVNTINGDFVFEAQEAYLIKNGKIDRPVKGATLVGNGPKVLMDIDMVASDLGYGIGTCGKEGQGVPVGHGMPTIRISELTVGGTG